MYRVENEGADFLFPEAFQLDVNDIEYVNNSLLVRNGYRVNYQL
jgi:hypothetical protein